MGSTVKNILAAVGAVVVIIIALSVLVSLFTGGGVFSGAEKVAVVNLEGVITDPTDLTRDLESLGERDDVKAVVLRINSPGGAVGPSQEIHGAVKKLRKTKKVVASMGTVAASGGFYAAMAADRIVANPGTITGSIGVIVEFINAEELLSKVGLKGYVVKSGRYKDTGSPMRKMEKDEEKLLQGVIDDVNSQFIMAVAEGRNLKVEAVEKIADGRVLTGAQAKDYGLVDRLGDLSDAIDLAAELSGIKGRPYVLYPEKRVLSLWSAVFGDAASRILGELLTGFRIMYLTPTPGR